MTRGASDRPEAPRLLLRLEEAARLLDISERNLWERTAPRGGVPCVRIGRLVRYSVAELEAFVRAGGERIEEVAE